MIIVDNLAVNYRVEGLGPKSILILHGWADSLESYNQFSRYFVKKYKVIRLDLPGFGLSSSPPKPWNLNDYALFIQHFLIKLKLKPSIVIGHSNGGALAIVLIADGYIVPKKLVLIASAGIRNKQTAQKQLYKLIAKLGKKLAIILPKNYQQQLRLKLYGTIGSDLLVVPELQETFKLTVSQDVSNLASKISLPSLLLFADNDRAIPLADGIKFGQLIKNSVLEVIKSNDHFFFISSFNEVIRIIDNFID